MMGIFERSYDQLELLHQMMDKTGAHLDTDYSPCDEGNLKSAILSCLACRHSCECRVWLDSAEEGVSPPEFCPNVARLMRMRQQAG